jgi:two-component system NarL family sensor kinase
MKVVIRFLIVVLLVSGQAHAQQNEIDSLKKALLADRTDTGKIWILSELAFRYANNTPDTAQVFVTKELELAGRVNLPKLLANAINDQALVSYYKGDLSKALLYNKKALEIRRQIGDDALIVSSLNKIAVIYQELGSFDKATEYELEVLRLSERLKNETYVGLTLTNLGTLLTKTGRYGEARSYIGRSIEIAGREEDTAHLATGYASLVELFEKTGKIDSAFVYQDRSIKLLEAMGPSLELSHAYNLVAYLYQQVNKPAEELTFYKKAMNMSGSLGNNTDEAFFSASVGTAFLNLQQTDSAYKYLRRAFKIGEEIPELLKTIYSGLVTYYTATHNIDSVQKYFKLYESMSEKVYSATALKQMNELNTRYQTEQKELALAGLRGEKAVMELSLFRKNIVIWVIAGSFLTAIALGGLFYNRYRMKQQARLQGEIIKQQQLTSKAVISAEEHERKRIAGDLHDGIGQMFSVVKMNLSGLAHRVNLSGSEGQLLLDKTIALVDESCKEVRLISHQMMPNVLLKSGLAAAVRDFIDKIDEKKLRVTLEVSGFERGLDSDTETVLYRVIQESVNNVIKHANASQLDIQLHRDENSITATIEDNGVGFDLSTLKDIQGIGIRTTTARVEFLNGKIEYDTTPGRGTLVAIYIPNKKNENA